MAAKSRLQWHGPSRPGPGVLVRRPGPCAIQTTWQGLEVPKSVSQSPCHGHESVSHRRLPAAAELPGSCCMGPGPEPERPGLGLPGPPAPGPAALVADSGTPVSKSSWQCQCETRRVGRPDSELGRTGETRKICFFSISRRSVKKICAIDCCQEPPPPSLLLPPISFISGKFSSLHHADGRSFLITRADPRQTATRNLPLPQALALNARVA